MAPFLDILINVGERGVEVVVSHPQVDHTPLASTFLEYYGGKVVLRVWNDEDENQDPTATHVLMEDPGATTDRVKEEMGL